MTLRIYGQRYPHDGCHIYGTLEDLQILRDEITEAIRSGKKETSEFFTRDGEGYSVCVAAVSEELAGSMKMPYCDPDYQVSQLN